MKPFSSPGPIVTLVVAFALAAGPHCPAQQPAAARPTRTYRGVVLDEHGKPIAGAAVAIHGHGAVDTARLLAAPATTSAADGTWRLTTSAPTHGSVVAVAAGRAIGMAGLRYDGNADATLPNLLLMPGTSLVGRIVDATGKPIEGASVVARSSNPVVVGRTDAEGHFTLPGLPATGQRVDAVAPGHISERCFAQPGTPLTVTLQASGFVRGRVVDDHGAPVAGVAMTVLAIGEHDHWLLGFDTRSSADGRFTIGIPCRGPFRVQGVAMDPSSPMSLTSDLLHGPADDVVIRDWPYPAPERPAIQLECTDAATGQPIPRFHATWTHPSIDHPHLVAFAHMSAPRVERASFSFVPQKQSDGFGTVTVEAKGYARTSIAAPATGADPLRVALGPEATLSGRVVDAVTGAPVADAALLALPAGMRGHPLAPLAGTVRTDADGRYRIGNLPAGDVDVQVFAVDRPASPVRVVSIGAANHPTLDLVVPAPRQLTVTLTGSLPAGPPGQLTITPTYFDTPGCSNPLLGWPGSVSVTGAHAVTFGPVDAGAYTVELWVPSRVRAGAGRIFALGTLDANTRDQQLALPALDHAIVRGRVQLPPDVPTARIQVQARSDRAVPEQRTSIFAARESPDTAELAADGSFAFDLPAGKWWLQLIDTETGIPFFADQEPRTVAAGGEPWVITPELHWLELELATAKAGAAIVFDSLRVDVPRPVDRDGKLLPFARRDAEVRINGDPARDEHVVAPRFGTTRYRWLVPKGRIHVVAHQREWTARNSANGHFAGSAEVDIAAPAHTVRMTIAALPFEEARLLAPQR